MNKNDLIKSIETLQKRGHSFSVNSAMMDNILDALRTAQEREKPLTVDDEIIETPEACPFCVFFDCDRELCLNRDCPCCGQWIKDVTFGCTLFEPSEQAECGAYHSRPEEG